MIASSTGSKSSIGHSSMKDGALTTILAHSWELSFNSGKKGLRAGNFPSKTRIPDAERPESASLIVGSLGSFLRSSWIKSGLLYSSRTKGEKKSSCSSFAMISQAAGVLRVGWLPSSVLQSYPSNFENPLALSHSHFSPGCFDRSAAQFFPLSFVQPSFAVQSDESWGADDRICPRPRPRRRPAPWARAPAS